jgi:hypothetical protein
MQDVGTEEVTEAANQMGRGSVKTEFQLKFECAFQADMAIGTRRRGSHRGSVVRSRAACPAGCRGVSTGAAGPPGAGRRSAAFIGSCDASQRCLR